MDKNQEDKIFGKYEVKVNLLLKAALEEACIDDTDSPFGIAMACNVLEALGLAQGTTWRSKSRAGHVTKHHMFIATDELRKIMEENGILDSAD